MLRQIMTASKDNSTIQLPAEFYGMEVEVLVFPLSSKRANQNDDILNNFFARHLFSFQNFTFNRDEANNYE